MTQYTLDASGKLVTAPATEKLFVYGIFLGEEMRKEYGMTNPRYATVQDYVTHGHHIVKAYKVEDCGLALTGLIVDMDTSQWDDLDRLEGGYERIIVRTTSGEWAYMYAGKDTDLLRKGTYEAAGQA